MSTPRSWAPPGVEGPALLERAVAYTRASLLLVADADVTAPTPCAEWDLLTLLEHMLDSLTALTDAADIGYVDLVPMRDAGPGGPAADHTGVTVGGTAGGPARATARAALLADRLKARACALLAAWAHHPHGGDVTVADHDLGSDLLAAVGSLEIAVHGWDVARACGVDRPLPAALALDLLDVVPMAVGDADRPVRFAERVDVPLHARPSDRLLAALGRTP